MGWPSFPSVPLDLSSGVDAVELDAATDPELPQSLQDLLVQAGGPQTLPIECQLQPSLLAQEQHLGKEDRRALQTARHTLCCLLMPHIGSPPHKGHTHHTP